MYRLITYLPFLTNDKGEIFVVISFEYDAFCFCIFVNLYDIYYILHSKRSDECIDRCIKCALKLLAVVFKTPGKTRIFTQNRFLYLVQVQKKLS